LAIQTSTNFDKVILLVSFTVLFGGLDWLLNFVNQNGVLQKKSLKA